MPETMSRTSASSGFMVAPSILSADFANLERELRAIADAGADWAHVDVMDGHFVPNLTIGAPVVKSLKRISPLPLDCHLMIENPDRWLEDFAKAGADVITVHTETCPDPGATLRRIRQLGCKAGITQRPGTPLADMLPCLSEADLVLVMTVNPGFSGQSFMPDAAAKVALVRAELKRIGRQALIEVDGGVTHETAAAVLDADVLVAGNYVFKSPSYADAIARLKLVKASGG